MAEWKVNGTAAPQGKKLPFISPWKSFSKQPEEEKEKLFNELRGAAAKAGLMESR